MYPILNTNVVTYYVSITIYMYTHYIYINNKPVAMTKKRRIFNLGNKSFYE